MPLFVWDCNCWNKFTVVSQNALLVQWPFSNKNHGSLCTLRVVNSIDASWYKYYGIDWLADFIQYHYMMVYLLLSGVGSVGFKSSFIVPVLWILSSILFGATSFSIVALANEVVEDRHIWLLSTSMIIMDKMINNRTTEIRTIMMGRNLAAFRLSIPVVVAANCFSPG